MPDFDRGDGGCKHLTADNLCAIYETRPALCRVSNFQASSQELAGACDTLRNLFGGR